MSATVPRRAEEQVTVYCSTPSCGIAYRTSQRSARRIRERGGGNVCEECRMATRLPRVTDRDRAWARKAWEAMSDEDRMAVGLALQSLEAPDDRARVRAA